MLHAMFIVERTFLMTTCFTNRSVIGQPSSISIFIREISLPAHPARSSVVPFYPSCRNIQALSCILDNVFMPRVPATPVVSLHFIH
jgi:hypothetical protein